MATVLDSQAPTLLSDPTQIFAVIVLFVSLIISISHVEKFSSFFKYLPAPVWIYVIPMSLTTLGVLPASHNVYDAMAVLLVPCSLFLLTVTSDFRSVVKMAPTAIIVLLTGTVGILLGGWLAYYAVADYIDVEAWKGFAVLSGAWIGGSANAIAVQQGLQAEPAIIGPLLIVDSLLGYGWIVLLLLMAGYQSTFEKWFKYDPNKTFDVSHIKVEQIESKPLSINGIAIIIVMSLLAALVAFSIAQLLPELGNPTIVSTTTWVILLTVGIGVTCSFTRVRKIEAHGASHLGYFFMLLLLASLGARGNFEAFFDAPIYLVSGIIWLTTHITLLFIVARLLKAPPVIVALGSVANIGGFVTSPIIASAYSKNFVPIALLMAMIAQTLGIYLPFLFAQIIAP